MPDTEAKIIVTYSGEMTPEIRTYLDQVEHVMNQKIDASRLVGSANKAANEIHVFGSSTIAEHEFLRKEKI